VGAVRSVRPEAHELELAGGGSLGYDHLVVCIGGRARPAYPGIETFWSWSGDLDVDELISTAASSEEGALAMIVPPGTAWSLPLYELALMIRRRAEEAGATRDLRIRLFTPEDGPLLIFGPPASGAVAEVLDARRIELVPDSSVVEQDGRLVRIPGAEELGASVAIALPVIVGPRIEGLPADEDGFIPVDQHSRVREVENVYAAGDGTNFPVKQGGLATQQADAAAEHLATRLGAPVEPEPFKPVLRGQLITGGESLNLRQDLRGGEGEGVASLDYLWWPPQKVAGRYLSAYLGHTTAHRDLSPPAVPLEVAVALPHEWHGELGSYDSEAGP
jgi:sulfide:quinone oxidoreductase